MAQTLGVLVSAAPSSASAGWRARNPTPAAHRRGAAAGGRVPFYNALESRALELPTISCGRPRGQVHQQPLRCC
jgi:hypothetical protein